MSGGTVVRVGERELSLSNLDKVFWPDEGITKGDLLAYYRAIAPTVSFVASSIRMNAPVVRFSA